MKRERKQGSGESGRARTSGPSGDEGAGEATDWRTEVLGRVRGLILEADGEIVEEVKWRKPTNPGGVAVWSRAGIVCTGERYKDKVKLTFMRGAALEDPSGLLNAGLDGGTRRAIDLREGERLDAAAFQRLVRAAVALNLAGKAGAKQGGAAKAGAKTGKGRKASGGKVGK